MGLKIELKGLGEIFVTGPLSREWQFFQIPIAKPTGLLYEIAISVQSPSGRAAGDIYLGPLSAFKVRTSSQIDWLGTLGKTDTEVRNLLKSKVFSQSGGGGLIQADQILENFTIDSDGQLVDGISFCTQMPDVSEARYPDGALDVEATPIPTPGGPNKLLMATGAIQGTGQTVRVTWSARAMKSYQVYWRSNLASSVWAAYGGPIEATGSSIATNLPSPGPQSFFKLIQE